jgi:hypothetical protein
MNRPSKFAVAGYVLLWFVIVIVAGIVLERLLKLPRSIAQGVVMFLGMVAFYPIEKWWEGERPAKKPTTFIRWALAMLFVSAFVAFIDYIDPW